MQAMEFVVWIHMPLMGYGSPVSIWNTVSSGCDSGMPKLMMGYALIPMRFTACSGDR